MVWVSGRGGDGERMRETARRRGFIGLHCVLAVALVAGCTVRPGSVDFVPDRTTGAAPLAVVFTCTVTGMVESYAWDFGDGGTSSDANPAHVYAQEGIYTVTLVVQTAAGPLSARKMDLIQVTAGGAGDRFLFWIERGSGTIHRASLAGAAAEVVVRGLIGPEDLVASGGRIYWTDPGTGTVESADLDGANRRTIAVGQNYPTGVAVDVARARVYWTTLPSAADASPAIAGAIKRAHLDGTGVETLATFAPQASFAWQIAVDAGAGKLYWVANDWVGVGTSSRDAACRGRIMKSGLDAKNPTTVAESLCGATDLALGGAAPARVYWTDEDAATISCMGADGTGRTVLVGGQTGAESVAVSPSIGKIYWIAGSSLFRANLDGSGVENVGAGLNLPEGVAVGG